MDVQELATTIGLVSTAIGVVSAAVAVIVSLSRWRAALFEQTRRVRLESARLAWELANSLHEEPLAANALELLDGETARVSAGRHGAHDVSDADVKNALAVDVHGRDEKAVAIRCVFDCMFYALDRMRTAIETGLISRDDLSAATTYYCNKLVTGYPHVLAYGKKYGYSSTVAFIEKFVASPAR